MPTQTTHSYTRRDHRRKKRERKGHSGGRSEKEKAREHARHTIFPFSLRPHPSPIAPSHASGDADHSNDRENKVAPRHGGEAVHGQRTRQRSLLVTITEGTLIVRTRGARGRLHIHTHTHTLFSPRAGVHACREPGGEGRGREGIAPCHHCSFQYVHVYILKRPFSCLAVIVVS